MKVISKGDATTEIKVSHSLELHMSDGTTIHLREDKEGHLEITTDTRTMVYPVYANRIILTQKQEL